MITAIASAAASLCRNALAAQTRLERPLPLGPQGEHADRAAETPMSSASETREGAAFDRGLASTEAREPGRKVNYLPKSFLMK